MGGLSGIPTRFDAGDVIFSEGDAAADLYLIRSGAVRITHDRAGAPVELAVLGPGDFFGEMGLFAPGPRSATATAIEDVEADVIDRAGFIAAVDEPIVLRMLEQMSVRIRALDRAIGDPPAVDVDRDAPPIV